jgi:hypothetical protein
VNGKSQKREKIICHLFNWKTGYPNIFAKGHRLLCVAMELPSRISNCKTLRRGKRLLKVNIIVITRQHANLEILQRNKSRFLGYSLLDGLSNFCFFEELRDERIVLMWLLASWSVKVPLNWNHFTLQLILTISIFLNFLIFVK